MNKMWKLAVIGLVILAFIGAASAQWQQNESNQIDVGDAIQEAEELLANAEVEGSQGYMTDKVHYRIFSNGEYIGVLWEDVNPDDLTIGEPYSARWGTRVPLNYNGETVGQLFLGGKSGGQGWQNGNNGEGGYCCGAANGQAQGQGPQGTYGQCDGTGSQNTDNSHGHGSFRNH